MSVQAAKQRSKCKQRKKLRRSFERKKSENQKYPRVPQIGFRAQICRLIYSPQAGDNSSEETTSLTIKMPE